MVVGLNDELMGLMYFPVGAEILVGDRLFTSGDGLAFPPDILVGTVVDIESDTVLVSPAAEIGGLDFVRVLDYDARALEPSREDSEPENNNGERE